MRSTRADSWPTWAVFVPIVAALATAVILALWWWRSAPQMGADEDALQAVDALFTAITARDERLLAGCEHQLSELRQGGKLPSPACDFLDRVISGARQGHWESSARSLYKFIRASARRRLPGIRPRRASGREISTGHSDIRVGTAST